MILLIFVSKKKKRSTSANRVIYIFTFDVFLTDRMIYSSMFDFRISLRHRCIDNCKISKKISDSSSPILLSRYEIRIFPLSLVKG